VKNLNGRQYVVLLEQTKEQFYSDLRERECDVGRPDQKVLSWAGENVAIIC
jgi:hypothetical protein